MARNEFAFAIPGSHIHTATHKLQLNWGAKRLCTTNMLNSL